MRFVPARHYLRRHRIGHGLAGRRATENDPRRALGGRVCPRLRRLCKNPLHDLPKRAPLRIEVAHDAAFLDRPETDRPAVILMDHCYQSGQGVLTDQQKATLLKWIRGGVGAVAVHASYYSFPEWSEVRQLYGPTFIKHEKVDQYILGRFVDRSHPISRNLPETFRLRSELYQSTPLPADCHLLAAAKDEGASVEHPSVWTRKYGKGRVVTILPAHWPDAYHVPEFQQLIVNSVLWATPGPRK